MPHQRNNHKQTGHNNFTNRNSFHEDIYFCQTYLFYETKYYFPQQCALSTILSVLFGIRVRKQLFALHDNDKNRSRVNLFNYS